MPKVRRSKVLLKLDEKIAAQDAAIAQAEGVRTMLRTLRADFETAQAKTHKPRKSAELPGGGPAGG